MKTNHKKVLWITRTAVLLALLLGLQWVTLGTKAFAGQYITGSLVNCVLAVAALGAGLGSGIVIAVLSPVFAYLLGIAPQLVVVPAIMVGNTMYVIVLWCIAGKKAAGLFRQPAAVIAASLCKFAVLHLLVVEIICGAGAGFLLGRQFMGKNLLMEPMLKVLPVTFSWPQLITALIGGTLAVLLMPVVRKVIKD